MTSLRDSLAAPGDLPDLQRSLALLRLAQAGNQAALEDLVRHYQGRLHRIVRVRMGASARRWGDSLDVVQDTWRVALRKLSEFEPRDHAGLLDWLATIATNQVRDAADRVTAAKRDPRREEHLDVGDGAPMNQLSAQQTSAGDAVWRAELREILDDAVARLSHDQREVIVLRDYCGLEWPQIAEKLGRPGVAAAKQLHQRAWLGVVRRAGPRLEHLGH